MDTTEKEAARIFWLVVESGIKTVVPLYVKNILRLFGYYSASTIQNFKRNQIPSLESFVQNDMELFIDEPNFNKKDYYYVFSNDIKKFYIIDGHKDLIIDVIVDFVKMQSKTNGLQIFMTEPRSKPKSSCSANLSKGSTNNLRQNQKPQASTSKKTDVSTLSSTLDINRVTDDLFNRLKSKLKKQRKQGHNDDTVSLFIHNFLFSSFKLLDD